jgi:hypothetical protein
MCREQNPDTHGEYLSNSFGFRNIHRFLEGVTYLVYDHDTGHLLISGGGVLTNKMSIVQ